MPGPNTYADGRPNGAWRNRAGIKKIKGDMDGISPSNSAIETATAWLDEFGEALALGKASRIAVLFANECP